MGLLDKVERALENGVNGAFSKVFRSGIKPVDIASAIRRCADDNSTAISDSRTVIPNEYQVELSPTDLKALSENQDILIGELEDNLTQHASSQVYSLVGPVKVSFSEDVKLATGTLHIKPSTKRGAVAPATTSQVSPTHPIIEIGDEKWLLTQPVTVIGRGSEADIVLNDSGVSRTHLELRITPSGVIATDLGSTNGTFVEGNRISAATLVDGNVIRIGRTEIFFWTHPA